MEQICGRARLIVTQRQQHPTLTQTLVFAKQAFRLFS